MTQLLGLLRSSPSLEDLVSALKAWSSGPVIAKLSTQDALVSKAIVSDALPTFWPSCANDQDLKALLIKSLSSLAGINALLAHRSHFHCLEALQEVLASRYLDPVLVFTALFQQNGADAATRGPTVLLKPWQLWTRYLSIVTSGHIIGLVAETLLHLRTKGQGKPLWLDDRKAYVAHLTRHLVTSLTDNDVTHDRDLLHGLGGYLDRTISLGDSCEVVDALLDQFVRSQDGLEKLCALFRCSSSTVQLQLYSCSVRILQEKFLPTSTDRLTLQGFRRDTDRVGAVAACLNLLTGGRIHEKFGRLLVLQSGQYGLSTRRAIVACYDKNCLKAVTDSCLQRWADSMFLKHTPVLDQEALTETILVLCAYLSAQELTALSKDRYLTEGISNHLESTSDRIRFLGMILGEAVSAQVIADEKKRLTFGVPDTQTMEAKWWRALIDVKDTMTEVSQLQAGLVDDATDDSCTTLSLRSKQEETIKMSDFIDTEESSDEEFETMRVPDSDDEDSDEDPTLMDRDKVHPPVYIRDLIKMINNHDSYKHVSMALRTAPSLIRRKAEYGTELTDYAINLVQIFAGLRDNFDMDDFQQMRQEALKSLVVACPKIVSPYLAGTLFTGDYSLQQRVVILSAIGLGARELAGFAEVAPQYQNMTASKLLPPSLLRRCQTVEGISESIQEQIMQPMASEAADSMSGPAALKVHKTTRKFSKPVQQVVNHNRLTPIAAEYVLFPLLGRFATHAGKMIDTDAKTFYESNLLAYYLRTVSIVFQASATSPALNRLTLEFWTLLLSMRSQSDHTIIEALLHALLILIDTNTERSLAVDFSRQLVETQEWCTIIFERVREEKIKMLSAGILIRIRNVVEHHQVLMMQSATMIGNIGRGRFGLAGLK